MSKIKQWYAVNVPKMSIEELVAMGHTEDMAKWLKEIFDGENSIYTYPNLAYGYGLIKD